ncbi:hypothetical protein H072_7293 [Dactylellina haptotyla CBS 200.50]|uniref:Major facilitator superfamily (MFS) profile domain-containing protein n=1 Tax=Dactylellina haptotyla (strain CBS 200.50) TaxID=1284197 RepID=S8ACU9_DACHA|nr:hypothetical protein H072_7293 [Dactylellina haptotyla CBS 200.50]
MPSTVDTTGPQNQATNTTTPGSNPSGIPRRRPTSFIENITPSLETWRQLSYIAQTYPQNRFSQPGNSGYDTQALVEETSHELAEELYRRPVAFFGEEDREPHRPVLKEPPKEPFVYDFRSGDIPLNPVLPFSQAVYHQPNMAAPGGLNEWSNTIPFSNGSGVPNPPSDLPIDPADLDFDSPDDKRNARNWHLGERIYVTFVPAVACFVVSFGASVYAPAVFSIQQEFGVTLTQALAGVTTYVLGMAFGPLIAGPISETVGRRAVYFFALPIAGFFSLGVAYAHNLSTILACRFFSAMFGAAVLSVGAGTVADVWDLRTPAAVYASCVFLAMAFMGPSFGPLVGFHVIADGKHWRWTMLIMCMLILPTAIAVFFARETYKKAILLSEARKQKLNINKPPPKEGLKLLFTVALFRPIKMIFVEPIVSSVSLYNGFCFAVFFAFFESIPYTLTTVYHSSPRGMGNSFLAIWIGVLLASVSCALFEHFVYQPRKRSFAARGLEIQPEERLYAALLGSILFPTGLYIWAWTAKPDVNIVVPLIGCVLFGWGAVATFIVTAIYMVFIYNDLLGASALGANSLVRYGMGSVFPLFTVQMYQKLGVAHAGTLLAGIATALLPIPWIIFYYGSRLRNRSVFIHGDRINEKAAEDSDRSGSVSTV